MKKSGIIIEEKCIRTDRRIKESSVVYESESSIFRYRRNDGGYGR